jgi:hypothetical protein
MSDWNIVKDFINKNNYVPKTSINILIANIILSWENYVEEYPISLRQWIDGISDGAYGSIEDFDFD